MADSTKLDSFQLAKAMQDEKSEAQLQGGRRLANLFLKAAKELAVLTEDYTDQDVHKMWSDCWKTTLDAEECIDCLHASVDRALLLRTLWAVAPPVKKYGTLRDIMFRYSKLDAWKKFIEVLPYEHYASVVFRIGGVDMNNPWILTNIGMEVQLRGYTRIVVPASGQVPDVIIMPLSKYIEEQTHGK